MIETAIAGAGLVWLISKLTSDGDRAVKRAGRSAAELAESAAEAANRAAMPCAFGLAAHKPAVAHDETGAVPYCRVCRGPL